MKLTWEEWQADMHHRLDLIASGADMCALHASRLPLRPDFETIAEADMKRCEAVLEAALARVRVALKTYRAKPVEE